MKISKYYILIFRYFLFQLLFHPHAISHCFKSCLPLCGQSNWSFHLIDFVFWKKYSKPYAIVFRPSIVTPSWCYTVLSNLPRNSTLFPRDSDLSPRPPFSTYPPRCIVLGYRLRVPWANSINVAGVEPPSSCVGESVRGVTSVCLCIWCALQMRPWYSVNIKMLFETFISTTSKTHSPLKALSFVSVSARGKLSFPHFLAAPLHGERM